MLVTSTSFKAYRILHIKISAQEHPCICAVPNTFDCLLTFHQSDGAEFAGARKGLAGPSCLLSGTLTHSDEACKLQQNCSVFWANCNNRI